MSLDKQVDRKNGFVRAEWMLWPGKDKGSLKNTAEAQLAVLMDLRDELIKLNRVFECHNALAIPDLLRRIESNTRKPQRKRAPKKRVRR